MNSYYKKKQIIARVDENGKVIGEIEKWKAHRSGVLHKALTVALIYKGQYIIQHRKHPAFDGVLDITSSSHQIYVKSKLQSTLDATYECLKREWNLEKNDLSKLKYLGSVYYKAKDPKSIYTEHEVCDILSARVKKMPEPNLDFAYGFSLSSKEDFLKDNKLAPWVKKMIEEGKL